MEVIAAVQEVVDMGRGEEENRVVVPLEDVMAAVLERVVREEEHQEKG